MEIQLLMVKMNADISKLYTDTWSSTSSTSSTLLLSSLDHTCKPLISGGVVAVDAFFELPYCSCHSAKVSTVTSSFWRTAVITGGSTSSLLHEPAAIQRGERCVENVLAILEDAGFGCDFGDVLENQFDEVRRVLDDRRFQVIWIQNNRDGKIQSWITSVCPSAVWPTYVFRTFR